MAQQGKHEPSGQLRHAVPAHRARPAGKNPLHYPLCTSTLPGVRPGYHRQPLVAVVPTFRFLCHFVWPPACFMVQCSEGGRRLR